MKSRIIAFVVIVALVMCAVAVMAQRGRQAGRPMAAPAGPPAIGAPGGGMGMGMGMCERMKNQLGLTPDQVKQIEAIRKDFMDSTQSQRDDIKGKMKQMLDLWTADQPDAGAIKGLAAQMESARAQMRDSAIDHAVLAFDVLTADQKAKVRAFVAKNPGMCMGMACGMYGGPGMGMGPGMGCGMGMGPGMGRGMGPGAGGANCPFAK